MRYLLLPLLLALILPFASTAQGILEKNTDPTVVRIEVNRKTKTPYSVLFNEASAYKLNDAQQVFTKYLNLRPVVDELKLAKEDIANNISVVRYQQYFKGIKVEHGSYIVTAKDGVIAFVSGDFYAIDDLTSIIATLSEEAALTKALEKVGAQKYKWELPDEEAFFKDESGNPAATYRPKAELVLIEDQMENGLLTGKVQLAYKFNVYAHEPVSRSNIYVDATSGKILLIDAIIKHSSADRFKKEGAINNSNHSASSPSAVGTAASRYSRDVSIRTSLIAGSYRLQTATATEGLPTRTRNMRTTTNYTSAVNFTDANNDWTTAEFDNANKDNAGLDAHWGAGKVYDYWKTRHARNSYNGSDAIIESYVHYSANYDNAYWDGVRMTYGDGSNVPGGFTPLTSLDVCAHEIGHAICEYTSDLVYQRESGAMNEGFSDIWGAAVEHYADPLETDAVAKDYFLIGEEITVGGGALRSMKNPNDSGQPDTYLGTYWVDASTAGCPTPAQNTNDYCGVHTNSGVLNYWFYLVVSGGTGVNDVSNSYAVPAISWVDAEKITYLAEQNLTSTSDYAACRTASINAATTLFGACSLQTEAVTRAWYAVNVGANFVPCTAQIGFKDVELTVNENASSTACPAIKTIIVKMKVEGPAPLNGNASVTVSATGTATSGQDYTIGTGTATFPAGSTADQNITINVIDDGALESTETIKLDFAFSANGSTATKSNAYTTSSISILDDDKLPDLGVTENYTVGAYATPLNNTSPFHSISRSARTQYIISKDDLLAYGVRPNVPINQMSVVVTTKGSTQAFTGYTISLGNTTATSLSTAWVTGLTQVYSGTHTTAVGANNFPLTPYFTWDGTSNLAIQVCFANASTGTANDGTEGYTGALSTTSTLWVAGANATGCALAYNATNNTSFTPRYTFRQDVPPTAIESTLSSNRSWQVASGNNSYFYSSADGQLIANISANNANLGCVTATVNVAGNGFTPFNPSPAATRSVKEFTITPSLNGATTNYDATIYYTDTEINGKDPASLKLVKTNAATDDLINTSNTVIVTPTIVDASNFKGFTGNFTGFSRFFLIDQDVALSISGLQISAALQNEHVLISWSTASELNTDYFVVERSYDGTNFTAVQNVAATGFSTATTKYSLSDPAIAQKTNYYRIKVVDKDGRSVISPVVTVTRGNGQSALVVSPNPVKDHFTIQYSGTGIKQITIVDMAGRRLKTFSITNDTGSILVDGANFASGVYMVNILMADGNKLTRKIVKQ